MIHWSADRRSQKDWSQTRGFLDNTSQFLLDFIHHYSGIDLEETAEIGSSGESLNFEGKIGKERPEGRVFSAGRGCPGPATINDNDLLYQQHQNLYEFKANIMSMR